MTDQLIDTLIDRPDTFELVRDKVAQILADNVANQQVLAVAEGKDPSLWALKIYLERARPWEAFQSQPVKDDTPIVNVWYSGTSFDQTASNVVEKQQGAATINIDVIATGQSRADAGGQITGDEAAALNMQRALKLVRSILMAAQYTYLELRGIVGQRWPASVSTFQPDSASGSAQNIIGGRLALSVTLNEFAPQVTGEALEAVSVDIKRAEDGQVLARAEYVYP